MSRVTRGNQGRWRSWAIVFLVAAGLFLGSGVRMAAAASPAAPPSPPSPHSPERPTASGGPGTLETRIGTLHYSYRLEMEGSAYYPGPESTGPWADGFTAAGLRAGHGVVAVDPEVIPLGTVLFIPGYGLAVAADVGSAIKGNKIDLCFDTYLEAILFGRRPVEVYVLQPEWVHAQGRHLIPAEWFSLAKR